MKMAPLRWIQLGVLLALLATTTAPAVAQDEEDAIEEEDKEKDTRPLKDRLFFGGGLNLQFGTTTNIGIDPVVGYKIDRNNKWSVGVGGSYNYTRWNAYGANTGFSTYGYRTFTRYRLLPQLFAHAEFNHMNMVGYIDRATARLGRTWVPFLLVGGGYSASLGGRTYMTFTILWDVLQDPRSPYLRGTPFVGGGFAVGF